MNSEKMADAQRAREEYLQLSTSFDYAKFLECCKAGSRLLIESASEGARYVAARALRALGDRSAFMLMRIGDGEANLLRLAEHGGAREMKWVDDLFLLQDNQTLSLEESRAIAQDMLACTACADVVGLRPLCPAPLDRHLNAISQTIESGDLRGAFGMIGAFGHAERALGNGSLRHAVITSAWVHLTLLEHLDRLLEAAPRVIVISGREELVPLFSKKLGSRLGAFLSVPVQASDQASPQRSFHYPSRYRQVIQALQRDLRGTLVLVGAGIFAKRYCTVAKQSGAVALDIGSAFDVLAGIRTRPVHSIAEFLDVKRESWLTISGG